MTKYMINTTLSMQQNRTRE